MEIADSDAQLARQQLSRRTSEAEDAAVAQAKTVATLKQASAVRRAGSDEVHCLAWSHVGRQVHSGHDAGAVRSWDAETGYGLGTLVSHGRPVTSLSCCDSGLIVNTAASDTVVVRDPNPSWSLVGQLGPAVDDSGDLSVSPFADRVLALDFSPDGRFLATGGGEASRSGELLIWNVEARSVVRRIEDPHSDTVFSVKFSASGRQLLSGGADRFVRIFDVASGRRVRSFEGDTAHVMDVSWQANGSSIVSAGVDSAIKVWNVETGEQRRTINIHSKPVTVIAFIGSSESVGSGSGDRNVRLLRTSDYFARPMEANSAALADRGTTSTASRQAGMERLSWQEGKTETCESGTQPMEPSCDRLDLRHSTSPKIRMPDHRAVRTQVQRLK